LVQAEQPEIVIYFCGDSPLIEPRTVSNLIRGLLADPKVELVELETPANGGKYIHEGFSIYRRAVWDRIVQEAKLPEEREHVGVSLKRFVDGLSKKTVPEDPIFSSVDHRISVDTPSDYRFMSEIYRRWYAGHDVASIVSLRWVIGELGRDSGLAAINADVRQKAVGDTSLNALMVCHAGAEIGLGHLSRSLTVARALQDRVFAGVRLLIQGDPVVRADLSLIPHRYIGSTEDLAAAILREVDDKRTDVVIFDIHPQRIPKNLTDLLERLREQNVHRVAIDSLLEFCDQFDFVQVPSFYVDPARIARCRHPVYHGWDCYLLELSQTAKAWLSGNNVLVLTGGSDATHLGRTLPDELDAGLPPGTDVHWVRGPYAEPPRLPAQPRQRWLVHDAPAGLGALMAQSNYALTVYGVSLFELLQHGVPTVVFSPYGEKDKPELKKLMQQNVTVVAADGTSAVAALRNLIDSPSTAESFSLAAMNKLDGKGAIRFAEKIRALVGR
jgi:spore coat polysaccharide biosynthesis predicted glycosyltransferase SpsG